jgi:hypothetical protein
MTRHRFAPITCGLVLAVAACVEPEDPFTSLTTAVSLGTTNSSIDSGESTGDTGDGDPGDGDGDPTAGDGDGDPTTTGDGDGDPTTTGDGDGDPQMTCGWFEDPTLPGYYCGGMGEDPNGMTPIGCPPGLVDGDPCGNVTGVGCCDANGDNWYCGDDGMGNTFLVFEACS